MFDVILLMAGNGTRSQLKYNKVFYLINNKPIYQYSLNQFLKLKECKKVILVVNKNDFNRVINLQSERIKIAIGGKTRQESVACGLNLASNNILLIHDAARCNVKTEDIIKVYQATKEYGACTLGSKVNDTIKETNNLFVSKTLNRSLLWAVQTPQGVKKALYEKCIKRAMHDCYQGFDDVELIEKYSDVKVKVIEGHRSNIKLTTPIDFKIMELLMKEGL